ncbi:hypothetical protein D3C86_1358590 [compost metagenome]
MVRRILSHQQGRITIADAGCDQPVGRQMRMGAGETIALKAVTGGDLRADDAPMGDAVGGIGNGLRGQRQVQDERFDGGNFHDRSVLDADCFRGGTDATAPRSEIARMAFGNLQATLLQQPASAGR